MPDSSKAMQRSPKCSWIHHPSHALSWIVSPPWLSVIFTSPSQLHLASLYSVTGVFSPMSCDLRVKWCLCFNIIYIKNSGRVEYGVMFKITLAPGRLRRKDWWLEDFFVCMMRLLSPKIIWDTWEDYILLVAISFGIMLFLFFSQASLSCTHFCIVLNY